MISTGQLIFAILFVIAFTVVIIFSYRKDKPLHKKYYKGSIWVLVGFLIFVAFLTLIKFLVTE